MTRHITCSGAAAPVGAVTSVSGVPQQLVMSGAALGLTFPGRTTVGETHYQIKEQRRAG
jgi:hypothetical protein